MQPSIEVAGLCPYCEYRWTLDARDIRGQVAALTCLDCSAVFVVKVKVEVSSTVHALADVDVDELLAELGKPRRPAERDPPAPPEPDPRPSPPRPPPAPLERTPRRSVPPENSTTSSLLTRNGVRTLTTREVRGSYGGGDEE